MKQVGISGSWRNTNPRVAKDVKRTVESIIERGDGIVSGGALGVDFIATNTVLKSDFEPEQLTVILPTNLETYAAHYRKRASEGVISSEQAESLISQLHEVQERGTLEELGHKEVSRESYFERNTAVLDESDSLAAFQVNDSPGTQDTIDKARARGMDVHHLEYIIAD